MVGKTVIAPLDRIKLFFVVWDRQFKYIEMVKDFRFIIDNYGFWNLWRGNMA